MTILDELQEASFKGARFLIRSGSTAGGRKTVTHEYPNTDRRYVEDLGALQQTFSITGITHGKGSDYFVQRDNLINALNEGGSGELVHPFLGTFTVTSKPFTLSEDTTELGVANFSMTFERSDASIFPAQATSNKSLINRLSGNVTSSIQNDIGNIFNVSRQFASNFTDGVSILNEVVQAFQLGSDIIFKVTDQISPFNSTVDTFERNINQNITDPVNLGSDLTNIFNEYALLGTTPENQFTLDRNLFDFGATREPILPTTVQRVQRIENRDIIDSAMRTNALALAYNITTDLTLDNVNQIDETAAILDDQYNFIIDDNNLSNDTVNILKDLRVEVRKFLDNERVTAFRIADVDTQEISTTLLAYQYYGNLDNVDQLIELNNTINTSFVSGETQVLTA